MANCREQDHIDAIRLLLARDQGTNWRDVPLNAVNRVLAEIRLLKEGGGQCNLCGAAESVTLAPDPYSSEICGNETPVWLCDGCRFERLMDI